MLRRLPVQEETIMRPHQLVCALLLAFAATWSPAGAAPLCFADATHGWAADAAQVWRTADGGASWTAALTSPAATGAAAGSPRGFAADVQCFGPDVAWVLFANPGGMMQTGWALYRTADGGASWTPVAQSGQFFPPTGAPSGRGGWNRVWLAAADAESAYVAGVCVACSLPGVSGMGTVSVGAARDGGRTWEDHPPVPGLTGQALLGAEIAVTFAAPEQGWVAVPAAGATVYHTTDGGATWQAQALPDAPAAAARPSP
jgi:photosystem II stability/assembly factor-like uncharacterized protein